jgi:acetyl esterase/lipase
LVLALSSLAFNLFAQQKSIKHTNMDEIKKLRESFDHLGQLYPRAVEVKVEPENIGGILTYWFTPNDMVANRIIIYLHGGSYAFGSIRSHESLLTHIASQLHSKILFIRYSLAPEAPYPQGMNDVLKVYQKVLKRYSGYQIDIIGDSAGGGLAISAISQLNKLKLAMPDALILISPWIDLTCNSPSYEENKTKDVILTKADLTKFAGIYAGNATIKTANPKNSDLSKFPAVLILTGANEILLDDSKHFYDKIKKVQKNSTLTVYENQNHVWLLSNIHTEASQKALNEMWDFLQNVN